MVIRAQCHNCWEIGEHELTPKEESDLKQYRIVGRSMGKMQDIFPNIPAWIRSGAIDKYSNGFCICPKCR